MRSVILPASEPADGTAQVISCAFGGYIDERLTWIMQGLLILKTMAEAIEQGFEYFDRTRDGYYVVRKMTPRGWALAIVDNR